MIRAALITIVFLGVTLTLILLQPSSQPTPLADVPEPAPQPQADPEPESESVVSRAETGLDRLETATETLDVSAALIEEPAAVEQPEPQAAEPEISSTPDIAASVATLPTIQASPQAEPANELERLIINALAQGQSEGYIDALVNDAASKGEVEVPTTMVTADGRVDTSSLLAVLSQPPAPEFGPGSTYVVQPGDSLASIAYRFYGTTRKAADIFMANRVLLSSPNDVEVGQTLALPDL